MRSALVAFLAFIPALAFGAEGADANYFVDGHRVTAPAVLAAEKTSKSGKGTTSAGSQSMGTSIAPTSFHSGFQPLTLRRMMQPISHTAVRSGPAVSAQAADGGGATFAKADTTAAAPNPAAQAAPSSGGATGGAKAANAPGGTASIINSLPAETQSGIASLQSFAGGMTGGDMASVKQAALSDPGVNAGLVNSAAAAGLSPNAIPSPNLGSASQGGATASGGPISSSFGGN